MSAESKPSDWVASTDSVTGLFRWHWCSRAKAPCVKGAVVLEISWSTVNTEAEIGVVWDFDDLAGVRKAGGRIFEPFAWASTPLFDIGLASFSTLPFSTRFCSPCLSEAEALVLSVKVSWFADSWSLEKETSDNALCNALCVSSCLILILSWSSARSLASIRATLASTRCWRATSACNSFEKEKKDSRYEFHRILKKEKKKMNLYRWRMKSCMS